MTWDCVDLEGAEVRDRGAAPHVEGRQAADRLKAGAGYTETGLVVELSPKRQSSAMRGTPPTHRTGPFETKIGRVTIVQVCA
jgi:hypothetical protein